MPVPIQEVLGQVFARKSWTDQDVKIIKAAYEHEPVSKKDIVNVLDVLARSEDLGEPYLKAMRAYYEVFFAEEEVRIRPALRAAVERAQQLATEFDVSTLLEKLTEGFHFGEALHISELILVPSYWIAPLVAYIQVTDAQMVFMFGGRPADASLVPGEVVPDALFRALKAMADPTRLRILRYLTAEPMTPAQLSRRLRLRAPTVVHHLRTLRLAGLVHLTLESGKKVHYTARSEAVAVMYQALQDFLAKQN
jgi:DNA-binding transcriptional ArsR family regulator